MASEIRVDKITSLSGVGTISPSPTGVEIAGITTVATLKATTGIVTSLAGNKISLGDNAEIYIGVGSDLKLTHDSNNSIITNSTGELLINSPIINLRDSSNNSRLRVEPAGNIDIAKNVNVGGIATFTDDVQFVGDSGISSITYDKSANQLNFVDNARARFGSGGDLNIYHNGVASFIKNDTGALRIPTSIFKVRNAADNEDQIVANQNAAVELFYDNTRRFETTGAGISVSQTSGGFSEFRHGGGNSGVRIAGPAAASGANLIFANNHNNTLDDRWTIQLDGQSDDLSIKVGGVSGTEKVRFLDTGGITFNGDTANANALDDYEEGDWTPTFVGGSGSITVNAYGVQYGKYVKIGKMVYVEGLLRANVTNNSNGTYDIDGLPFTIANTISSTGIIHCKEQNGWTVAPHHFSCLNNTTKAKARGGIDVGDSAYTNANTSGFASGSTNNNRVYFAGWYRAEG